MLEECPYRSLESLHATLSALMADVAASCAIRRMSSITETTCQQQSRPPSRSWTRLGSLMMK